MKSGRKGERIAITVKGRSREKGVISRPEKLRKTRQSEDKRRKTKGQGNPPGQQDERLLRKGPKFTARLLEAYAEDAAGGGAEKDNRDGKHRDRKKRAKSRRLSASGIKEQGNQKGKAAGRSL